MPAAPPPAADKPAADTSGHAAQPRDRTPQTAPQRHTPPAQPVAVEAAQPAAEPAAPTGASESVRAGDDRHVVRPGESLWSIASDALGPGAGNVQIAELVHQLWELNGSSIASGSPNVISPGQMLVMPAGLG